MFTAGILLGLTLFITGCGAPMNAQERATVQRIVDGDTLRVEYRGKSEPVRLIGIDTPESRKNRKAYRDAHRSGKDVWTITKLGKEAARFAGTLVRPGQTVVLEFDVQTHDRYGRLLCYVYLPDGRMLNEEIVKAGYASPMTIPPNVKYQERFLAASRDARENQRGLWKQ